MCQESRSVGRVRVKTHRSVLSSSSDGGGGANGLQDSVHAGDGVVECSSSPMASRGLRGALDAEGEEV